MQKIHRVVGRDQKRVQQLLVLASEDDWLQQNDQNSNLNKANIVFELATGKSFLNSMFSLLDRPEDSAIFIVDPMGNLMLGYSGATQPVEILEDLKVLLTATKNWNRGCAVCPTIKLTFP